MMVETNNTTYDDAVLEAEQKIEEALEAIYPAHGDSEEPINEFVDRKKVEKFASKFHAELQGEDARKMMFVMDVAIHTGETPRQLRKLVDQQGIEPLFKTRMASSSGVEGTRRFISGSGRVCRRDGFWVLRGIEPRAGSLKLEYGASGLKSRIKHVLVL